MALWMPVNADVVVQAAGMVVRTGNTPNTVVLALTNSVENFSNVVGTRLTDVAPGAAGLVVPSITGQSVRLLSEPNIGDLIYLSNTVSGCGTNVPPSIPFALGIVYEKTLQSGIWYAKLIPEFLMSATTIISPPGATDAFGRLRVSNPVAIFDSKLIADNDPVHWDDQQTSGAGTSSTFNANQGSVTLGVSNLTAGSRVRQTYRRFTYQPGKSQLFSMTGILGVPTTGITSRIGAFDASNGMFFESGPTGVAVVIRSNTSGVPVEDRVLQANWNYDKMDGSGPSGIVLDPSKTQIFMMDFQWLGVGRVRFGFDIDGVFQLVHVSDHANLGTLVYMSTPNGPLRYEISNDGTGPAATMLQICAGVISEGGIDTTGTVRAVSRNTTPLITLNNSSLYPLLAIRVRPGYEGANVKPFTLNVICTSSSNIEAQLLLNPTIVGGALSFSAIPGSVVEADNTALNTLTVTGGTLLSDAVATTQAVLEIDAPSDFQLGVSIAGVRDVLVLAVRRLTGAAETFYGSLGWRENF